MSKTFEDLQAAHDRWAKLNVLGYSRTMFWYPYVDKRARVYYRGVCIGELVTAGEFNVAWSADMSQLAANINRCCEIAEAHRKGQQ